MPFGVSSTTRRGTRRQPEASRSAILQAALGEFAQEGIAGARMDAIAAAAGVNKALLYYYFRDKEALYGVPGANVELDGSYDLKADALDFHGALKLEAKVSQMVTGWKHWLLKPVDPFLSKNGAG